RRPQWAWLAAAVILGALGLGVLTGSLHVSGLHAGNSALDLRAIDNGGRVRIEWNRFSDPILEASKGSLLIVDGGERLEKSLSPELLHSGGLVYHRKSPDVEIRLRVYGSDPAQELTRLMGLSTATAAPPAQVRQAA